MTKQVIVGDEQAISPEAESARPLERLLEPPNRVVNDVTWNALLLMEHGCAEETATRFAKQWSDKCAQLATATKALEEISSLYERSQRAKAIAVKALEVIRAEDRDGEDELGPAATVANEALRSLTDGAKP